jgi:Helix-turn-helix domain
MQPVTVWSWRHAILCSKLEPTTRHLLLTLSCHMNDVGESCFPSIRLLSDETGLHTETICIHLRKAADAGFIEIANAEKDGQKWRRNSYSAKWPEVYGPSGHLGKNGAKVSGLNGEGVRIDPEKVSGVSGRSTTVNSTGNPTTDMSTSVDLFDSVDPSRGSTEARGNTETSQILTVFNTWKDVLRHPNARLDEKRRRCIRAALALKFTADDLAKAFRGCRASPFHMGANDRQQRYDDITLILRDAAHIERFMGYVDSPPSRRDDPDDPFATAVRA